MTIRVLMALLLGLVWGLSSPALAQEAPGPARPNVILLIADDVSWDDWGCYGHPRARTPHVDALAAGGLRFTQAFLTASSCSPSRSSVITGRYPHNLGAAAELHREMPAHLPWFPTLLRASGYYTALVGKNHMRPAPGAPAAQPFDLVSAGQTKDNAGGHGRWVQALRDRPRDKPFFFWFAAIDAHRDWEADRQWREDLYGPKHRARDMIVPPCLIDDEDTRRDLASYHNEVTRFDWHVGQVVAELKAQGVMDDTLLLVMADNGRAFPGSKTRVQDTGMKTALIAHWLRGIASRGAACDSLVSAIDLAPTILSLAGVKDTPTVQGVSLLPLFADPAAEVRRFAFSEHNWHDYEAHARAVRSEGYLYIRNARPALAWQGPADSVRSPAHRSLLAAAARGGLSPAQADVLLAPRPDIELYHTATDPLQLRNLAADPAHAAARERLAQALRLWAEQTADSVPERLSPDKYSRTTGGPADREPWKPGVTPGSDRGADRVNHPGPR